KGRLYYYHRSTGKRLEAVYGTQAFADEVRALDESLKKDSPKVEEAEIVGTLGALVQTYRAAPEFIDLAPRTRKDYLRVLDYLKPLHGMPLVQIDKPFIYKVRDKAYRAHKRRFANYVLQVLGRIFTFGTERGQLLVSPATRVTRIRKKHGAVEVNRAWTDEEVDVVLAAAPSEIRIAIALGLYTGARQCDVLTAKWDQYKFDDADLMDMKQRKTNKKMKIPIHSRLREILAAAPKKHAIIVVGSRGKPFTGSGFRARFFKFIRKLKEDGKVAPGLTFHGLRHTMAKRIADSGGDTRDIMSITGHETEAMVANYTKEADQERRARSSMARLEAEELRKNGKPSKVAVENKV
ncbi:MAG TPA: tyrosine-type recombinase/integrase, partial [Stellaceae bacterium]|nr:tyrosine-type recombinase/integrase [Stellaceae bacterium]